MTLKFSLPIALLVVFGGIASLLHSVKADKGYETETAKLDDLQKLIKNNLSLKEKEEQKALLRNSINDKSSSLSIQVHVHRNGEADPCGSVIVRQSDLNDQMHQVVDNNIDKPKAFENLDKYQVESLLTRLLALGLLQQQQQDDQNQCLNIDDEQPLYDGMFGYCDRGPVYTPILTDHDNLIRIQNNNKNNEEEEQQKSLPCRFFTREGIRISSLSQFLAMAEEETDEDTNVDATSPSPTCQNHNKNEVDTNDDASDTTDKSTCQSTTTTRSIHVYAVSAGRVFMFAPKFVGEIFDLSHVIVERPKHLLAINDNNNNNNNNMTGETDVVDDDSSPSIFMKVLSVSPRVFEIFHFFSKSESRDIVDRALSETSESHRIKRSTTGAGSRFSKRTSESGFDTHGHTAVTIKKRCLQLLGFDSYIDGHTDGLQVLRYNQTTAYIPHMDYMDNGGPSDPHDYDSRKVGGNRFATILLYMSDLSPEDGGQTVFSRADPLPSSDKDGPALVPDTAVVGSDSLGNDGADKDEEKAAILAQLRSRKMISDQEEHDDDDEDQPILTPGSWEEDMATLCQTRLSVRPQMARSILFYSQQANGRPDRMSLHGGCPVLSSQPKWAANLWVWNTPRGGFEGSPLNPKYNGGKSKNQKTQQLKAVFHNTGRDEKFREAELFYQSKRWGKLGHGDESLVAFTYPGHKWDIRVADGTIGKQFIIGTKAEQHFEI